MKKEFRGFGKIFSFTFLHHVKSKGYIASTLIIAMLCLLIPVGVLAGRELIGGGEPEPELGMEQEMETTMELETGDETDLERELEKLQYLLWWTEVRTASASWQVSEIISGRKPDWTFR